MRLALGEDGGQGRDGLGAQKPARLYGGLLDGGHGVGDQTTIVVQGEDLQRSGEDGKGSEKEESETHFLDVGRRRDYF